MLPFLAPRKESIWLRVTLLSLTSSFLAVVLWVVGNNFLPVNGIMLALSVGAVCLALSVIVGKIVASYALQATDF